MLERMMRVWQAVIGIFFCGLVVSQAAEGDGAKFTYKAPVVGPGLFNDELGMMDKEREEYALNIANYVANRIAEEKGSVESLALGRRLIALSLHLSPRNRKAVVMNYQLEKGILQPHLILTARCHNVPNVKYGNCMKARAA